MEVINYYKDIPYGRYTGYGEREKKRNRLVILRKNLYKIESALLKSRSRHPKHQI